MAGVQQLGLLMLLAIASATPYDYRALLPKSVTAWTHYRQWADTHYNPSIRFEFHRETYKRKLNGSAGSCRIPTEFRLTLLSCIMEDCKETWCRRRFGGICKLSDGYCGLEIFIPHHESASNKTWHCRAEDTDLRPQFRNSTFNKTFDVTPSPYPRPLLLVVPGGQVTINPSWTVDTDSEKPVVNRQVINNMKFGNDITKYRNWIDGIHSDPLSLIIYRIQNRGQTVTATHDYFFFHLQVIYRVENMTIRCLVTMSSISSLIWMEGNEGSTWIIRKAKVVTDENDRTMLPTIQEVDTSCLKSTTVLRGIMVPHWPTFYEHGIEGIMLATSDGIWTMDAEGQHCQQLYATTWPYGVIAIAADWRYVYWVTELGELFSKALHGSQEKRLDDFKLWDNYPCNEAPDFTNISHIATYGPEQWTPTVPVECFDLRIAEPELDFESEEMTVKIQWNMTGACANISRPPIKIKIEFDEMGCDGEACKIKPVRLGYSFAMTRTIDLPRLKPSRQYVIITSVAPHHSMQQWLIPLLGLPCNTKVSRECFIKARPYRTPEPNNLEKIMEKIWKIYYIACGVLVPSAIIIEIIQTVVCIKALVWYIRKQQRFIFRKISPLQFKRIDVICRIGVGKGHAGTVSKVEVTKEDGSKQEAAMKVIKGTDGARRKLAYESFVHDSLPTHENVCGYKGITFSSITKIVHKNMLCKVKGECYDEQQGPSANSSASSRSTGSRFQIDLPYGMEYFSKQLKNDTNSDKVLCEMMLYLSRNMTDTSTTIRYRPLNDNTIICETADPDPQHRTHLATLTKKKGSITLSTQVDSSMFDEQSDNFGKEVLLLELCHGSLDKYIKQHRGGLTFGELLDIVIQVAQGAVHLQENSVRHNDLTLDNVLYVIKDGKITYKIADFGEAKLLPKNKKYYGAASRHFPWMFAPPEMFKKKEISGCTEVWFLTYFIYQVFTYGERPWDLGSHPTVADMQAIHNNQTPPEIDQSWPQQLKNIIKTGLEADKVERCADVSQVLEELQLLKHIPEYYSNAHWPADHQQQDGGTQNNPNKQSTNDEQPSSESILHIGQGSQCTSEQSFSTDVSQSDEDASNMSLETVISIDDPVQSKYEPDSHDSVPDLEKGTASFEVPPNAPTHYVAV